MNFSEIELPSNKKFGFFFTFLFSLGTLYFYLLGDSFFAYPMFGISLIFLLVTILKSEILLPLNKIWMKIGLLMGLVVSPIVMGIIFFGLFTPLAILFRLFNRDELNLKLIKKRSHWRTSKELIHSKSFKNQF